MSHIKLMKAGTINPEADGKYLQFPLIASPKVDGIRAILTKYGFQTASGKQIPNTYTQAFSQDFVMQHPEYIGCDGELICGELTAPNCFHTTQKQLMSFTGTPDFTFLIFDQVRQAPFIDRLWDLPPPARWAVHLRQEKVYAWEDVLRFERECLVDGFEGVMLRHPDRPYKHGRSSCNPKQQHLMKLKRFTRCTAKIIGYTALEHNENELGYTTLGVAKRSSSKLGKVSEQTLGALVVRATSGKFEGVEFKIGAGFTEHQRKHFWENQVEHLGAEIQFKYQSHGSMYAPRQPIFIKLL